MMGRDPRGVALRAARTWALGASTALVACAAAAGEQSIGERARADSVFSDFGPGTPGVAAVVVREGEVVFRAGYGMADLDHGIPVTPETVFDIASVSKQFAGFAIASLVESGQVDVDAEVRTYLPELPEFGSSLTVRHLVHHTSGIRDWPLTLAVAGWRFDDVISFDQILRMAWNQRELNFEPGSEYSYSNTGYNLLAEIVQRVTGQTFRAWTSERIFEPLGMRDSHFQDDHLEVVEGRAHGHMPDADGGWTVSPNGLTALGSSSLHSTVDDLARWLVNYDTHEAGGGGVISRMRTKGILTSGDTIAYAYGIRGITWRGRETWTHTGSWAGNRTVLYHFPEIRSGVVVLANEGTFNPTQAATRLADIFLGDVLPDEAPEEPTPDPVGRDRGAAPQLTPSQLAEYRGDWVSFELDTHYRLRVENDALVADHFRHGRIELSPSGPDRFEGDRFFFRPVRFERLSDGSLGDMLVGEGRARNLRFVRDRSDAPGAGSS